MKKRLFSILLVMVLLFTELSFVVNAEENKFYKVKIDAGNGIQTEAAIVKDNDIYILAANFSKYTKFSFDDETMTFLIKGQEKEKAFKKVMVNPDKKLVSVGTKIMNLNGCYQVKGKLYLPLSQMLGILNAGIIDIDSGVIYVVNSELSMAELLYDFNPVDYWFNIDEEFFHKGWMATIFSVPSYIYDTVVKTRWDRLDIVFDSGACTDYKDIFLEYVKDDSLFEEAMNETDLAGKILKGLGVVNDQSSILYDAYSWMETIAKLELDDDAIIQFDKYEKFLRQAYDSEIMNDDLKGVLDVAHKKMGAGNVSLVDVVKGIDFIYSYVTQTEDHTNMLDAVYNLTDDTDEIEEVAGTSKNFFVTEPDKKAARQIYNLYHGDILPAMSKELLKEAADRLFEGVDIFEVNKWYGLTVGLVGEIIELFAPGDSGDRGVLSYHANIANTAMAKATVPELTTEKSTNDYRESLLLMMIASRKCYQILEETALETDIIPIDATYYTNRIKKLENMIKGLYLVADNAKYDSYEYFEKFTEENKKLIEESGLLNKLEEYLFVTEEDYVDFLKTKNEYNYYAVLDVNQDGVLEMLATTAQWLSKEGGCEQGEADLFIYKDEKIEKVYEGMNASPFPIEYNSINQWIYCDKSGGPSAGFEVIGLDNDLKVKKDSIMTYVDVDDAGNDVISNYYNDKKVTNSNEFEQLLKKSQAGKNETIIFKSIPKNAPDKKAGYCISHQNATTTYYDLNGDGKYEEVYVNASEALNQIEVRVGGATKTKDIFVDNPTGYYSIVNIDAKKKKLLIAVSDYGASEDPITYFYGYDGKNVKEIGSINETVGKGIWGGSDVVFHGDGTLTANVRMDVMGTWRAEGKYRISDGKIEDITEFYKHSEGWSVMSKMDIYMYKKIDDYNSVVTIPAGTSITMTGCKRISDEEHWVAFKSSAFDGTLWVRAVKNDWLHYVETVQGWIMSMDAFDGFYYAG